MLTKERCAKLCGKLGWKFLAILPSGYVAFINENSKEDKISTDIFELLESKQDYIEDFESSPEGFERYSCGC